MGQTKTAIRTAGLLFLLAILSYASGNTLVETATTNEPDFLQKIVNNQGYITAGALLMLINSFIVFFISVLLLPLLKQYNPAIAYTYFGVRIIESIVLMVGIISLLLLIPLGHEFIKPGIPKETIAVLSTLFVKANYYAYQVAMMALGLGSLFFCYLLYQTMLVPRALSIWGLLGYGLFFLGTILELFGYPLGILLSIPGGLFEVVFGIWLIVKGLNLPEQSQIVRQ